jgi:hypothetical protein
MRVSDLRSYLMPQWQMQQLNAAYIDEMGMAGLLEFVNF